MTDMILVYIHCVSADEAKKIGVEIMKKRLAPCYNILPGTFSAAHWPPKTGKIEEVNGAVLLIKSVERKYAAIESVVKTLHNDKNPCIFAIPVARVSKEYYQWLVSEMEVV